MGESKSEQARGTEQGPPCLFGRKTVGPETETGKNKATAIGLEVTDKGSDTVTAEFHISGLGKFSLCISVAKEQNS